MVNCCSMIASASPPSCSVWQMSFTGHPGQEIADGDGNLLRYDQVFHADGPRLEGPMTRGCFSLVIDPERAADYAYCSH